MLNLALDYSINHLPPLVQIQCCMWRAAPSKGDLTPPKSYPAESDLTWLRVLLGRSRYLFYAEPLELPEPTRACSQSSAHWDGPGTSSPSSIHQVPTWTDNEQALDRSDTGTHQYRARPRPKSTTTTTTCGAVTCRRPATRHVVPGRSEAVLLPLQGLSRTDQDGSSPINDSCHATPQSHSLGSLHGLLYNDTRHSCHHRRTEQGV